MLIQDIIPPVKKAIKPVGKIIKKQSRNKYVSAILALLLVFQTIAGVFIPFKLSLKTPYISSQETKAAGEGWYNTGGTWNYRRAITLSPATPAANYQVKVTFSSTTLTGAQLTGGNANGNDIRFTGSDGSTLQNYWIESWNATGTTVTATIWVKVIILGESTIYMYYGNSGATAGTDGANTFDFFDDFSGDLSKWTALNGSWSISSGVLQQTDNTAQYWLQGLRTASAVNLNDRVVAMKMRLDDTTGSRYAAFSGKWLDGTEGNGGASHMLHIELRKETTNIIRDQAYNAGGKTGHDAAFTINFSQWYLVETKIPTGTNAIKTTIDGTEYLSFTDADWNQTWQYLNLQTYLSKASFDDVRIRKYAATEPAATVGSEEYFDHYTVTSGGLSSISMNAGGSQVITITAKTNLGNTYNFSGDKSLTFSGPGVSGGGNNPTCTDKTSADVNFGTATTITLASGVGTCTMKLYKAETSTVNVTDGTMTAAGYTLTVAVSSTLSGASILINSNDVYTTSNTVVLTPAATNASQMKFSNDNITYSAYEAYGTFKAWNITNVLYGGTSADGAKTVYAIYKDAYGNETAAVNDNIVYDTTVPVNPTSAIDAQGAVSNTWQNSKNAPNFTSFTGASDANGIAGYFVYFGTDPVGVSTSYWVASAAYNPASFTTSNTRYLRVIAKDNAGLYADPDGAGTTCTNTNASRPIDPNCWATIFTHKYDIDAPNTPNPVSSSPASWTNTNSFNFSWSNPGDVGGSGVKDYTYQTNAGTGAATTASTSVNGLTSSTDGAKLFSVKANDNAGNSGANGTVNFYYDSTPPTNAGTVTDGNGSFDNIWGTISGPSFTWVTGTDSGSGVKDYDVYWGIDPAGTTVTATVATNAYNPPAIPANTPYYLRIRTRDNAGNASAWATKYTMKYSQAASTPSGLSQTANSQSLALGSWTSSTAPALNFTLSDPDSDTLGYIIKIDDNSDFSSPEVFYTYGANDLVSGGSYSFITGQAAGTGTYTNGSAGQTLAEGQYYWKIKAVESHGLASSEITANSGGMAFGIDTGNPTGTTLGFGTISATSIGVAVSGASDTVSGLAAAPYYFENTTAAANSGWQAGTSWNSTPLSPNTQYTFKVTSKDKAGNTQAAATQNKYTLANVPSSLGLASDSQTRITASWNSNSNSAGTQYYAENTTAGTSSGWTANTSWSSSGLACGTSYSFRVKAKNNDGTETAFTDATSAPTNACPTPTPTPASSAGGGGLPPQAYNPPSVPPSTSESSAGFTISINNGSQYTNSRSVILGLSGGIDAMNMSISEDQDFKYAIQEPYQKIKSWVLSSGDGMKTIYAKFYTQWGQSSKSVSSAIILDTRTPKIEIINSPSPSPSLSPEIPKSITGKKESIPPREKPPVEVSPSPEPARTPKPSPEPPEEIETPKPAEPAPVESAKPQESVETSVQELKMPDVNFDFIKKPAISIYHGTADLTRNFFKLAGNIPKDILSAAKQDFGGLKKSAGSVSRAAKTTAVQTLQAANSAATSLLNGAKNTAMAFAGGVKAAGNGIGSASNDAKAAIGESMRAANAAAVAVFNNAKNTMITFVGGVKTAGNGIGSIIAERFTPMQISSIKATSISPTSVEVSWKTNHNGTSKVNWGLSRVYDQEEQDSAKVKNHSIILTGLKPGAEYHYEVISQNGSYAYDADRIFYTPEE